MSMVQLGILGIVGAIFALQLKTLKAEFAILVSLAVGLMIFFSMIDKLEHIIATLREMVALVNLNTAYLGVILKMLGVTYVAEFASSICKDAGAQSIASQIEILGKLTILVMSLPILLALMKTMQALIG